MQSDQNSVTPWLSGCNWSLSFEGAGYPDVNSLQMFRALIEDVLSRAELPVILAAVMTALARADIL